MLLLNIEDSSHLKLPIDIVSSFYAIDKVKFIVNIDDPSIFNNIQQNCWVENTRIKVKALNLKNKKSLMNKSENMLIWKMWSCKNINGGRESYKKVKYRLIISCLVYAVFNSIISRLNIVGVNLIYISLINVSIFRQIRKKKILKLFWFENIIHFIFFFYFANFFFEIFLSSYWWNIHPLMGNEGLFTFGAFSL